MWLCREVEGGRYKVEGFPSLALKIEIPDLQNANRVFC
ncbi:hypothetical protein QF042_001288 [Pedobacter sp. W3I1]|nr:hypothetical protein [Pedobacter sp. W3I1]